MTVKAIASAIFPIVRTISHQIDTNTHRHSFNEDVRCNCDTSFSFFARNLIMQLKNWDFFHATTNQAMCMGKKELKEK